MESEPRTKKAGLLEIGVFVVGMLRVLIAPAIAFFAYLGSLFFIFLRSCYFLPSALPIRRNSKWKYVVGQIAKTGFEALPIVFLMAFLIGAILALQAAKQLEKFGASIFVADLVALSLTREIAPILISIIVAGRTGSAIASEIGTMLVTEEITALKAMGVDPAKILVMPKMVALLLVLPGVVLLADLVGIAAGFGVGCFILEIAFGDYYSETIKILSMRHIWIGLQKCFAFAVVIATVGAYHGFSVKGGAEGVGRATTNAVVDSIILIIAVNSLFTLVSYYSP